MSIYLDEKNPGKHKPFEDASPDIVEYVRYLEVIAGKSANTAFNYFCDLRGFSRFMKRRRGLVPADSEMQDIDPKGLDTAFWASVTKEDIYEYLYFLNRECGNKKSSTARRLASLHGFYDYLVNQVNRLDSDPTAAIKPPKQDKVLPKYLTAEQSMDLLESTQTQSDFPERDYCMVVLFLNCGMRLSELVGMDLDDIDLEQRQIRLFGKGHKERMVYLNDACVEALQLYLNKRNVMEGLSPKERAVFVTRRRKERISNRRVEQLVFRVSSATLRSWLPYWWMTELSREKSILPSPGSTVTMQSLDSRVPAVAAFLISMLFSSLAGGFFNRYTVLAGRCLTAPLLMVLS